MAQDPKVTVGKSTTTPVTGSKSGGESKPDTIQQQGPVSHQGAPDTSAPTVSRPLGGLVANPTPAQAAHDAGQSVGTGPQITSTASMQGHPLAAARPDAAARTRPPAVTDAMKKEAEAQKKGAEVLAKHNEALAKAKEEVANRVPEGKTGHSISPTVRQDEELLAARAMGLPVADLTSGELDRPLRENPNAPISHSITATVREDEELGLVRPERAITKEQAKITDYDSWVGSNQRQLEGEPGGIVGEQSASNKKPNFEKTMGVYDGRIEVKFEAGTSNKGEQHFEHAFGFELPNVVGALGMSQMNKESIIQIIEEALVRKLGFGGVLRK